MRGSLSTCLVLTFLCIKFAHRTCHPSSQCQRMDSSCYSYVCRFDSKLESNFTADALFDCPVEELQSLRLEFNSQIDLYSVQFSFETFFQLGFLSLRYLFILNGVRLRTDTTSAFFQMDELVVLPKLSNFSFHVTNIEFDSFPSHLSLRHLNVSSSRHINFDQLCKVVNASGPTLEAVYAEGINDGDLHSFTGMIDDAFFSCFQNTSLRILSLSGSNIKIMSSPNLNVYVPFLELLDVSRNNFFIDIDTFLALLKLQKLKTLIAIDVPFTKDKVEHACDNGKWIQNRITHPMCQYFYNGGVGQYIPNLEVFNIGGSTDCLKSNTFYCISNYQCMFPNNTALRELYLDHICYLRMDILFSGLNRLEKFDFSFNQCEYISSLVFSDMTSLTTLFLNGNFLAKMEESDPEELRILFRQTHELQTLNLSANGFSWLPVDIFASNAKLEVLDLSNNRLHKTDWLTSSVEHLHYLNIAQNLISEIDIQTRNVMADTTIENDKSIVGVTSIQVKIAGNPLSCNCGQEDMIKWLADHTQYISDIDGIVCADNAGFLSTYTNDIATYSHNCSLQRYKGLFALCIIPIIAIICAVLYIRHYRHILRIRRIRKQLDEFVADNFHMERRFLLYLAYSFSDSEIVLTKLFPELENRLQKEIGVNGNLVCISDRDFDVGVSISDEIINAVSSSRAVLFILSKEFARSRWCEFEAEIALYQGKPMILVTLGDVKIRSLPNSLRKVCFKWTRLEWPVTDDQAKLESFWKKLVNAVIKYADDDPLLNRNLV